jgi:hypothetical protein
MALVLVAGCGDEPADDGDGCLEALALDCQPAYPPTFRNLFDNELGNTCGSSVTGSSCHSAQGAMGGLVLETFDAAHAHLLGEADGRARVLPGDPECSLLMQRLESTDTQFRMPPGASSLPENVRCAFRQWIANGAEK